MLIRQLNAQLRSRQFVLLLRDSHHKKQTQVFKNSDQSEPNLKSYFLLFSFFKMFLMKIVWPRILSPSNKFQNALFPERVGSVSLIIYPSLYPSHFQLAADQCDQIGRFSKALGNKFPFQKWPKKVVDFWAVQKTMN